jgi:hypothetical protein
LPEPNSQGNLILTLENRGHDIDFDSNGVWVCISCLWRAGWIETHRQCTYKTSKKDFLFRYIWVWYCLIYISVYRLKLNIMPGFSASCFSWHT